MYHLAPDYILEGTLHKKKVSGDVDWPYDWKNGDKFDLKDKTTLKTPIFGPRAVSLWSIWPLIHMQLDVSYLYIGDLE